jgi:hypothetical protein
VPANQRDSIFYTHQGLTFGGIITKQDATTKTLLLIGNAINDFLKLKDFKKVIYKKMPFIYGNQPTDEDEYMLFRNNAKHVACNISTCIEMSMPFLVHRSRRGAILKSKKQGLSIQKNTSWQEFWAILEQNLWEKYQAKPVHSLEEILMLNSRFQNNIKLFTVSKENQTLGGIVIYESEFVAHAQYISISSKGKELCALDFIIDYLICSEYKHKKFFDLGSSTEKNGHFLNETLIFQKEGFGGRGVCYNIYEYDL